MLLGLRGEWKDDAAQSGSGSRHELRSLIRHVQPSETPHALDRYGTIDRCRIFAADFFHAHIELHAAISPAHAAASLVHNECRFGEGGGVTRWGGSSFHLRNAGY